MLDPEELARLRAIYQRGQRVRFIAFGEPDRGALTPGTEGVVRRVDAAGTIHVDWDDGTRLGLVVAAMEGEREDRLEQL
jgi:hypothetical protein